jgi:hypothetical protein
LTRFVFDNASDTVTAYVNGMAGEYWIESPATNKRYAPNARAWMRTQLAKTPGSQPGEKPEFSPDQYYDPPENVPLRELVVSDTPTHRIVINTSEFTKVRVTWRTDAGGRAVEIPGKTDSAAGKGVSSLFLEVCQCIGPSVRNESLSPVCLPVLYGFNMLEDRAADGFLGRFGSVVTDERRAQHLLRARQGVVCGIDTRWRTSRINKPCGHNARRPSAGGEVDRIMVAACFQYLFVRLAVDPIGRQLGPAVDASNDNACVIA